MFMPTSIQLAYMRSQMSLLVKVAWLFALADSGSWKIKNMCIYIFFGKKSEKM